MHLAIRIVMIGLISWGLSIPNASAQTVVVPPLVARGAPAQTASNMTALISSELEFMGEFENVNPLEKRPSQLGPNCLNSTPCLAGVAKLGGSGVLLAGKVTKYGEEFEVALTYMKSYKIVRTVKRRMSTDPMSVADELAFLVRHAVTGVDPAVKAAEDKVSGFAGGGVALMDEEEDEDDDDLLMAAPAVVYTPSSDPLGDPGDGFDEDPREDDDRAGGAAYGAAAVGATAGVAAGAAASASSRGAAAGASARGAAAADAFDPDAISFGGSADDISFGSAASLIEVDDPPEDPVGGDDDFIDLAPTPAPEVRRPAPRERKPQRQRQPTRQRQSSSSDGGFEVGASLGYARFQFMNFLTYGIEASYEVTPNIAVVGGFDAYTTKRTLPPEEVEEGQPASAWNTLLPLHLGAVYRPTGSTLEPQEFRPYIGGGIQLIPGYVKEGGGVAFGMRALGGADYALTDNFAVHLAIGTGFWTGEYWYLIDDLRNFGFIFQTNIGAVLAF